MSAAPTELAPPILVDQTEKFVTVIGDRDYLTAGTPDERPLFMKFIDEATYKEMLSGVVIECVDLLVYNPQTESFLIGTRQQEPQAGDWVIGGRMRAGEAVADSATRNMKRELGLDIDQTKLRNVGHYKMIWDTRDQPALDMFDDKDDPKKVTGTSSGCHMASTLELYPLDEAEVDQLGHNEEYSSLQWLKPDDILNAPVGTYHPCLVDMVRDGLETVTAPEPATTAADQHLRLQGAAATAVAALRHFEANNPKR